MGRTNSGVTMTISSVFCLVRDFDWKPKVGVEEGVPKFVEWFKAYNRL